MIPPSRAGASQGITLTELLVASAIAVVVMVGIGTFEGARARMEQELKDRSGLTSGQAQVALASFQFARELARADRFHIHDAGIEDVNPRPGGAPGRGRIQIRFLEDCATPGEPSCFDDDVNNYRWDEYRRELNALVHYQDTRDGCGNRRVLAREVHSLTFRFRDEAPRPPGGEPFDPAPEDNNALEYSILWDNGEPDPDHRSHEFHGLVESRSIAYSDVAESDLGVFQGDSGVGVDVASVSDPPGLCGP